MATKQRPINSAGTYGFIGVLRRPSLMFRRPSPEESQNDLRAVQRGEARKVSCFLRGSFAPYPRRLRQGVLYLSGPGAQWEPFWSVRRMRQQITGPILSVATRPADHREPNVKQGGWSFVVNVPSFTVVTCHTPCGVVDLVVPSVDVPLVTRYFKTGGPADRGHTTGTR